MFLAHPHPVFQRLWIQSLYVVSVFKRSCYSDDRQIVSIVQQYIQIMMLIRNFRRKIENHRRETGSGEGRPTTRIVWLLMVTGMNTH